MKTSLPEILASIAASALLWSCATNSARALIEASKSSDPVVPDEKVIARELDGRAFELSKVDFGPDAVRESLADIPDEAHLILLRGQVQRAFQSAGVTQGDRPPYPVDILINQLKFTKGTFLVPDPSILHVTMQISRPDGTTVMRGELESRYLPTITVIVPGVVGIVPTGFEGQEWQAFRKMIPAVSVAITRITSGLQSGKGLDAIEVYPEDHQAGGVIMPDSFLKGEPYGLSELTAEDVTAAVSPQQ